VSSSTPPTAPSSPSASTGVKYPASVSAGGPLESSGRANAASTSTLPTHSSEVSLRHAIAFLQVRRFVSSTEMNTVVGFTAEYCRQGPSTLT